MILRILGEGQYELPAGVVDRLNELDDRLAHAIENNDHDGFRAALGHLLESARAGATPVAPDWLGASDVVLPGPDATLEEVADMLSDEGLIPG